MMSVPIKPPLEAVKKGKCSKCRDMNTLDTMVQSDDTRSEYHCIDCETIADHRRYRRKDPESVSLLDLTEERGEQIKRNDRLRRLMRWLCG